MQKKQLQKRKNADSDNAESRGVGSKNAEQL